MPLSALALLTFSIQLCSQVSINRDSASLTNPDRFIQRPGFRTFSEHGLFVKIPETPVPSKITFSRKTPLLLDSLESKAARYLITRKLYELVVVSDRSTPSKTMIESSEAGYEKNKGKKIRNIEIRRLSVFGSDIHNPELFNPNKTESILNRTHLNTNEFIIRKNLLFEQGDTISPLTLSENERILRQLPFIEDSRIVVLPVDDCFADILVLTRDVYSLGASFDYSGIRKGSISIFDKNLLGIGHEFRLRIPYDSELPDSPGFGISYNADNISKTFINLDLFYYDGLGKKTYGFNLERKLVSAETKYAGGISIREMFTTEDLDTLTVPEPLKYNLQDYWISRSFLIDRESVSRIILGARYTNNNVFNHPFILPDSYHYLQKYKMFLGSAAFSIQKYYKTSLIYSYGRTEDIPYGGLINATLGKEINEFKNRIYAGLSLSAGRSFKSLGYFYTSAGISSFFNNRKTEQGMIMIRTSYFSNLYNLGVYRIRNFIKADYTRGFDRNSDEYLEFNNENGFSGFRNDTIAGQQRLVLSLESVFFSPSAYYGFRFAFFAFADLGYLFGTNEFVHEGEVLSSIGIGVRMRNDNLVFNTFQLRLGFFPSLPLYSKVNYLSLSGEQLFNPSNFNPGPPSNIPYR